jgi:hypothetical protein
MKVLPGGLVFHRDMFLDIPLLVTGSAQPHIHMYMFCPYIIYTLYQLLEESQM